jgi:Second Messenger Oligonucleotide or Dinucleotide Synthetase domain
MLTIPEAFAKFKTRLELTEKEQKDASRRQQEIRAHMDSKFHIETDFLTGSYRRWTKTKPLKDVDIFEVLGEKERHYRSKPPSVLLADVQSALEEKYGVDRVTTQRRSVCVDFGVSAPDDETDEVMSIDVVPAFTMDDYYEIPDTKTAAGWTKTNPKVHFEKAVAANEAFDGEWKALVRMVKYWNNHHEKPMRPSFLIEVMALAVLHPPFGGSFEREIQGFFHALADRLDEAWPDPAGLGPPVSDSMDATSRAAAKTALQEAGNAATTAIRLGREGKNGAALQAWRSLFGPLFPLS